MPLASAAPQSYSSRWDARSRLERYCSPYPPTSRDFLRMRAILTTSGRGQGVNRAASTGEANARMVWIVIDQQPIGTTQPAFEFPRLRPSVKSRKMIPPCRSIPSPWMGESKWLTHLRRLSGSLLTRPRFRQSGFWTLPTRPGSANTLSTGNRQAMGVVARTLRRRMGPAWDGRKADKPDDRR